MKFSIVVALTASIIPVHSYLQLSTVDGFDGQVLIGRTLRPGGRGPPAVPRRTASAAQPGYSSGDSDTSGDERNPRSMAKVKITGHGPATLHKGPFRLHRQDFGPGQKFKERERDPMDASMKVELREGAKAKMRMRGSMETVNKAFVKPGGSGSLTFASDGTSLPITPEGITWVSPNTNRNLPPAVTEMKMQGPGTMAGDAANHAGNYP